MYRRFIALASTLALILLPGLASGQISPERAMLNGWTATLNQVEAALGREDLADDDLDALQNRVQSVVTEALTFKDELAPRVRDLADLLGSIALPEGTTIEDLPDVAEARERYESELEALTGIERQTELVRLRGDQLLERIVERRSQQFATALYARGRSALSPTLIADLAAESVNLLAGTWRVIAGWSRLVASSSDAVTLALGVVTVLIVGVVLVARALFLRWVQGPGSQGDPTRTHKIMMAFAVVIVDVGVPLLILIALRALLSELRLLPPSIDAIVVGLTVAVAIFTVITGLTRALTTPRRPAWRIAGIADGTARRTYGIVVVAAAILSFYSLLVQLANITATPAFYVPGIGGLLSIPTAILGLVAARIVVRGREALSTEERRRSAPWRILTPLAGLAALITIAAAVTGYLAFATFMVEQIAFVWVVVGGFVLLNGLIDVVLEATLSPDGKVGHRIALNLGLSDRAIDQMRVIVSGVAKLVLVFAAVLLVAAPWGFDSTTIVSRLQGLYYGVEIGSIRITFATILTAALIFVAIVAFSRVLQGWLEMRFLPTTGIDPGLKNSIRTATGYIGFFLAAILAAIYAGIDFASIAIVAGALSVGIGFGLQSIVNNFVSGLILLAERPIRAGDWIEVGPDRGTVTRISVRATEIETFERASVIVPNSNLISGVVTNRFLRGNIGRIEVAVGVSYGSDADQVRDVLLACAKANDKVLEDPAPFVLFMNFGESSLDFELRCYVSDISQGLSTRSDLRFAILRALRDADIEIPFPQRDINLRDLPDIERALKTANPNANPVRRDRNE
ncbi:mechanosensitive ion channel domain-containing protein [Bauldia sp.]|uniref:mechanosensitive ion channel domain-containing protein n=1 Tax=Bauldia sp. TaxID=2575872 RepID=UPI003BA8C650